MRWSDLPLRPTERILRQFGGLGLVAFGGLACWRWLRHDEPTAALVLATVAVTMGLLGVAWPRVLRPVFVGWMVLAFPIGWAVSHVLLALVYYGMITPLALLFRLLGRDQLDLRGDAGRASFWETKPSPTDVRRYFRTF